MNCGNLNLVLLTQPEDSEPNLGILSELRLGLILSGVPKRINRLVILSYLVMYVRTG